ncbi:MAG: zinc-ribbon domain-containing protein [gamma proteobacterium symbiont of Lucinoma myriamae]|nr:zinc-ribbon domain-containing protein [gamma proteobacterium symbiont of Lucinoma myriamae]MCU7819727.1 zinc-ribbon domain-containing protein [gamma proteobacterium symbiont of Lucinoma myriamae]MCU7832400.1 zinc-ribbon domain-containing protein [gamma proteobacterium symbiont of Lucinoma myriamae]
MFTHCPNCHTHFEITQEYLDIAHGKVRCGQCDHVFNALDNLYNEETSEATNKPSETTSETPEISNTSASNESNDLDVSIPAVDIKEKMERIVASLSAATQELKNARKSTTFQKTPSEITPEEITHTESSPLDDELLQIEDSQLADELLQIEDSLEINELPHAEEVPGAEEIAPAEDALESEEKPSAEDELDIVDFNKNDSVQSNSSLFTDFNANKVDPNDIDILNSLIDEPDKNTSDNDLLNELDEINTTLSDESKLINDELSSLDDEFEQLDNGDDLLAELEQLENDFLNNTPISAAASQSQIERSSAAEPPENNHSSEVSNAPLDDFYTSTVNVEEQGDSQKSEQNSVNKSEKSSSIQEEIVPSFLTQNDSSSNSPMVIIGWLAATIILLLMLASQYLHFNSIKLSQDPQIRPFLESICPLTGCSLPLMKTPKKVITVTHDVRTHPTVKNALEIQLTFKNKAAYTQSYPILEITFSNPVGEIIARRQFLPDEYMKRGSYYTSGLKSNQSQEISLKVVDPDPDSLLSFQFNYL